MKKYIMVLVLLVLCNVAYSQAFEKLKTRVPFKSERYDRVRQDFKKIYVENVDIELDLLVKNMQAYAEVVIFLRTETNCEDDQQCFKFTDLCVAAYLTTLSNDGIEIGNGKSMLFSDLFNYYLQTTGDRVKAREEIFSDMFSISTNWGFVKYVDWYCTYINKK